MAAAFITYGLENFRKYVMFALLFVNLHSSVYAAENLSPKLDQTKGQLILEWSSPKGPWFAGLERECTLLVLNHTQIIEPQFSDFEENFHMELGQATPLDQQMGWAIPCLLKPLRSGNILLPTAKLQNQGQTVTSAASVVEVETPLLSDQIQLHVALKKNKLFVGEWTELCVTWTSNIHLQDFKALNLVLPIMANPELRLLDPIDAPSSDHAQSIGLPVGQRRVIGKVSTTSGDDLNKYTIEFRLLVQAIKAKTFNFPAGALYISQEVVSRNAKSNKIVLPYPSYFNNNFFDKDLISAQQRRLYCQSHPLNLEVQALPKEGQPEGYSGLINLKGLQMHCSSNVLSNRQALQIELTFQHPYPNTIGFDSFSNFPEMKRLFHIPKDSSPAEVSDHKALFRQSLWPNVQDDITLPSLGFSSFNTEKNCYETFKTESIPLHFENTPAIASASLGDFGPSTVLKSQPRDMEQGVWHSRWEESPLLDSAEQWHRLWASLLWPIFAFFVLMLPSIVGHYRRKIRSSRCYAFRQFVQRWKCQQQSAAERFELLQSHLLLRLELKVQDSHKILSVLQQKLTPDLFVQMADTFQQLEQWAYSGDGQRAWDHHKALVIIKKCERSLV